jgi:predicted nucleic acid-binding protein
MACAHSTLIAATAIDQDCALVSRNKKHFAMIEGLRFEGPQY